MDPNNGAHISHNYSNSDVQNCAILINPPFLLASVEGPRGLSDQQQQLSSFQFPVDDDEEQSQPVLTRQPSGSAMKKAGSGVSLYSWLTCITFLCSRVDVD